VIAVDVPAHVGLGVVDGLPLLMALAHALVLPPLNDDPLAFAPIHHLMVMDSYVRVGPWRVAQADLAPALRLPVTVRLESRVAVGAPADKPALLAEQGSRGLGLGGIRDGSVFRSHLLPAALASSPGRCLDLGQDAFLQVAAFRKHSWGSRGRRFKSGRPDWSDLISNTGTGL
jgi:hypothetical protein